MSNILDTLFNHPIHPLIVHFPIGLTGAALFFILIALLWRPDGTNALDYDDGHPVAQGHIGWRRLHGGADLRQLVRRPCGKWRVVTDKVTSDFSFLGRFGRHSRCDRMIDRQND